MNASKLIAASLVIAGLAGCEGQVSVDLETTAPADRTIVQVGTDLEGVEFREAGGGTSRLEFTDPLRVDLTDLQLGNSLRLFTDEQLSDGHYTGVRLIFAREDDDNDEDVVVRSNDDDDSDLQIAGDEFSDVDFTVDENDSSNDRIVLTLDLRQSLAFNDDDVYTLTPVLRSIRAEDAGRLTGAVTAGCPAGGTLAEGGAAYLFSGSDVTPDDRGSGIEPYLTTAVNVDSQNAFQQFDFPFLPEGDYTLSLTCDGDEDDAATNDDIRFQNTTNVTVREGEQTTRNLE